MDTGMSPHIRFFADFIEKETGIVYNETTAYQLENRLIEISKNFGLSDARQLMDKARTEGIVGHFKQLLLDVATNNETSFYRDGKIFAAFEKFMLPDIFAHSTAPVVKIWSAACSFGQEPYSLAMLLQQMTDSGTKMPMCEITATDISTKAVDRVKKGLYSQLEIQRGLPVTLLVKYFEKAADDYWSLKPTIRKWVHCKEMNLLKISGVMGPFDIIFCRNVLIYQNEQRKKEIIRNLTENLREGGFFVLGAAESMMGLSTDFEQVMHDGAVFYRKKVAFMKATG